MKNAGNNAAAAWYKTHKLAVVLTTFVLVLILGVFSFLKYYYTYIDRMLYSERLAQMREVTTQLFSGLEDVVASQWETADAQRRYLEGTNPQNEDMLLRFMQRQASMNALDEKNTDLLVVDSDGRYYTQNGFQGSLVNMDYLLSDPERVNYVYKSLTTNQTQMCFMIRLSKPVVIYKGNDSKRIIYCGIARDMEELSPYFKCTAYNNTNSIYITDKDGARLFSSDDNAADSPIHGYNVYRVLRDMNYLHGSSFDSAATALNESGIAYSNAVLEGREYYYAIYTMANAAWNLLFIVPSDCVAVNTMTLINTTVRLIMIFSSLLIVVSSVMIFFVLRIKQKQALDAERRNSETLAAMNEKLTETARAAESASRAKTDFLANMSHDIRTPMNAIVGIANLMGHEQGLSDNMANYVHKIQTSSHHLLGLINDVLDMSKIESNEVALNVEPVSLAEQIGHVDSIIRSQAKEREQTFTIRTDRISHEYLLCDGVRLRQIFLNILSNAIKYTQRGGTISFDISELPSSVDGCARFRFVFTDNGQGMSPEFIKHIFESFTREENSGTNKVQGTGLGMAITKKIVDIMGGTIDVDSTPGKGSRFDVMLDIPINPNVDYRVDVSDVLLISDDTRLIDNMTAALSPTEVRLHTAGTSKDALGILSQYKVGVVFISMQPGDSALADMVSTLRAKAADALFIFCVDYITQDIPRDMLTKCGLDGFISRPFFLANMLSALDHVYTAPSSENSEASILSGMNFMCAEDNDINAEILEIMLKMYGASCKIYPDGQKLVDAFKDVKPGQYDAILMDIQMPNMNGLEATRALRNGENPLGKTIPIVAMTANAFSEDVRQSIDAGMDAHISKPIDITLLERTMRRFSTSAHSEKSE